MSDIRERLATELCRIEAHGLSMDATGRIKINAGSLADAVIELCGPIFEDEYATTLQDLIAELRGIEMYADRMDPMVIMREAIDHAETKLREVQGE